MSRELIARSPDLRTLEADGYCLHIADDAYLVINRVPYVTASREVQRAKLVMALTLQGDATVKPSDHVAYWTGEHPHHANGKTLDALLVPQSSRMHVNQTFPSVLQFSAKADYQNYHHKVTTYVEILGREARSIDRGVSAQGQGGHG